MCFLKMKKNSTFLVTDFEQYYFFIFGYLHFSLARKAPASVGVANVSIESLDVCDE